MPRAVREGEMVAAGRRLFARRDYHEVSVDEIARRADVSKPMVYAYFESKEGLYLACVEDAVAELMRKLEAATPSELPADERLWRGLLATFEFVEESRETWELLHPPPPRASGRYAAGEARANEAMTALVGAMLCDAAVEAGIDRDVAREGTEPLAHALVAATQAVAAWWLRHPEESTERQALRLMNFCWKGLESLLGGRFWLPSGPQGAPRGDAPELEPLLERLRADRSGLLDELFERMAAGYSGDAEAVVEWRVDRDRFQLRLDGGRCELRRGGRARPTVTLTIGAEDLLRLVTGATTGAALFNSGAMKVDGDVMLAAHLPGLFRVR